jgi:Holliday junction resolvase-like predicted endonuclease
VLDEPVTAAQRARIARAAEAYLAARPDLEGCAVRLDLIAVRLSRVRARVVHRPGAIGAP